MSATKVWSAKASSLSSLRNPYQTCLIVVTVLGAGALGGVLAAGGDAQASLWLAVVASLTLLVLTVWSGGGVNTFTAVFGLFHFAYGLSGPVAAVYGAELPAPFTAPYETSLFLLNYSLATVGLAVGILVARPGEQLSFRSRASRRPPKLLAYYAISLGVVAAVMEIVNCLRVGGISVLLQGKDVYQSLTADLTLDLPSNTVAMLATAMMSFAISLSRRSSLRRSEQVSRAQIAVFILTMVPLLAIVGLLGQRGLLLGWVLIALVGVTYGVSVRRVSVTVGVVGVAVYLVMGMIYANRSTRGVALYVGNWSEVAKSALGREALLRAFNPAANEFGITLGNFSEYVKTGSHPLGLGRSYVVGLVQPVPSSLYPYRKPQQVGYAFRDEVFPGQAERGSIAGTAYSSILEAYYNFRELGVLAIYVVVGVALVKLERYRVRSDSLWFAMMYLMLVPSAVSFHRSAFTDAVITPGVLNGAVVAALWLVCSFLETALATDRRLTR